MNRSDSTISQPVPDQSSANAVDSDALGKEDLPDIYIGAVKDADGHRGERPDVVITQVEGANTPEWSLKRAIITGLVIGAFFGSVFFAGYAGTSAWICSARLDCGHWAPITIVSSVGAFSTMILGGIAGYALHRIYRLFKVT